VAGKRKQFARRRIGVSLILLILLVIMMYVPSFWQTVYPIYFYPQIKRQAAISHVDPLLIAAVARVESHFREDDISHAGAIGLMQLMPATAKWLANQIGDTTFQVDQLMDPTVNIRMGSTYLRYLLRVFHGNLPEAIAAYNAGPNRVKRWIIEGKWSGDEISVQDIPVTETRHFVERVMFMVHVFHRFY
jgi:soluble lytic murein transglycosylase